MIDDSNIYHFRNGNSPVIDFDVISAIVKPVLLLCSYIVVIFLITSQCLSDTVFAASSHKVVQ